jgi:hypothetical protein
MSPYVKPSEVHAPKRLWSLVEVLFDGGEGESALAIGRWENKPVLAMRWNGDKESPLGNPQSRGLPTWFIVPQQHWKQILETEQYNFSDDKITFARHFLELKRIYFLSPCPNPACPNQQRLALHQFHHNDLEKSLEALEKNELKLYHVICDGFWRPVGQEKADLASVLKAARESYRLRYEVKVITHLLEGGLIECSWSEVVNGRLCSFPPAGPAKLDRDQFQRQLKAIGRGASDDQLDIAIKELGESRHSELWIPQNTSRFFALPGPA